MKRMRKYKATKMQLREMGCEGVNEGKVRISG
jgi:hypothetical protein